MYELLGICVVLAALLLLNAGASLATATAWRLMSPFIRRTSARARANYLFAMRTAGLTLSAAIVALLLIPSYLSYEPRSTSEVVSKKLALLAIVSLAGVLFALSRTVRSWLATRTLRNEWLANSELIAQPGIQIPTYRIVHRFPIIAVSGSLRPKLFIAANVLESLTEEELSAAIAHECGHLSARDNLKRSILQICRDTLFFVPFGRGVDRLWAETAESAADEYAAQQSPTTALNLASALVTIAKMVPVGARADVPLGAYLVGAEETHGVKTRIRRLIEIATSGSNEPRINSTLIRIAPLAFVLVFTLVAVAVASNARVLFAVHGLIERAVNILC